MNSFYRVAARPLDRFHIGPDDYFTSPARAIAAAGEAPRIIHLRATCGRKNPPIGGLYRAWRQAHIWSIITWPKPEQETWVAPSSRRAKS